MFWALESRQRRLPEPQAVVGPGSCSRFRNASLISAVRRTRSVCDCGGLAGCCRTAAGSGEARGQRSAGRGVPAAGLHGSECSLRSWLSAAPELCGPLSAGFLSMEGIRVLALMPGMMGVEYAAL